MNKYILIIGNGSYVLNDNYGNGVVLRSVIQWNKIVSNNSYTIVLFYRNENKKNILENKLKNIKDSEQVILKPLTDLEYLISSKEVFASFISVPDSSHYEYIQKFLSYKIPTWIVKPLTDNLDEAINITKLENKDLLWIDYHKRFDTSNMLIKKFIKDNNYGRLLHYAVQYTQPYDLPMNTFAWTKDTNVFSYIGCHYVDQLEFLFEKEIKKFTISSLGTKGKVFKEFGKACYDSIIANMILSLKNEHNIICTFQVGWSDPKGTPSKSHQRVELTFENGRIIMDQKERGVEIWDENKLHHINPYFFIECYDSFYDEKIYSGYGYDSIKYFLDFSKNEKMKRNNSLPFLENILFSEYVLDASKESLQNNGKWIEMELKNGKV